MDPVRKVQDEVMFKRFESSQQYFELYLEETFKLESQIDMDKIEKMKMDVYRSPYREPYREEKEKEITERKKMKKKKRKTKKMAIRKRDKNTQKEEKSLEEKKSKNKGR